MWRAACRAVVALQPRVQASAASRCAGSGTSISGTRFDKLGVAAVRREAELGDNMATQVLLPGPAPYTLATGTIVINNDPITRLRSAHPGTGEDDLSHDLMAERQRSNTKVEQTTQEMQLRATHPRMRDAYQGLPCPHRRDWHRFDL